MESIKLFDQDGVTVLLCDLYFDKEINGVRATVEIQNRNVICVNVALVDLWDGERFHDDYCRTLCPVLPGQMKKADFLEINSIFEDNSILKFYNGYLPAFSFRVALYAHEKYEDSPECFSKGNKVVISKFTMSGVTVMPAESFKIESDSKMILASAKYYIPFELPKADAVKAQQIQVFEDDLTARIRSMEVTPQEVLVAKYGEIGKPRFYDIENMCIYNLGTSAFSRCCANDIAFMELSTEEIDRFQNAYGKDDAQRYFYSFSSVSKKDLESICNSKRLIGSWDHIEIDTTLPNTPYRFWESLRRQYDSISIYQPLDQPETACFGIRVTLHQPTKAFPAGVMKPLLDGIVCAFHERNGIDNILHTITHDSFNRHVVDAENNISILGKKDYVKPYRVNSIKWNPADERLKFAWVSVVTEDCTPYIEGKLFSWVS